MAEICEHEFETRDSKNHDYSKLEYDLYARLNMTIRKNFITRNFEIARISTGVMIHQGTLEQMVEIANELEGAENTRVRCRHRRKYEQ
jgi:hypothetical protein